MTALSQRIFDESRGFFALLEEEKLGVSTEQSPHYRRYIPFGAKLYPEKRRGKGGSGFQLHLSDEQLLGQPTGVSESLQIHRELPTHDPDVAAGTLLHGTNQWPPGRTEIRATLLEYYETVSAFAVHVLEVFSLSLDLDKDLFRSFYHKPLMQLRLILHPATGRRPDAFWGSSPQRRRGV